MITVFERAKTFHGLDGEASVIGSSVVELRLNIRRLEIVQRLSSDGGHEF
jgi:hypothetical protein